MAKPRTTSSTRYDIDELNRLVIRRRDEATRVLLPPQVVEGRFVLDADNRLVYEVARASQLSSSDTPQRIALDGTWKLTANHRLALALHQTGGQSPQTVYLKGAIARVTGDQLVFVLRQSDRDGVLTSQELALAGRWAADTRNRLNFLVQKFDGTDDRLVFQGGWEVGPDHTLTYRYQLQPDAGRSSSRQTLTFEGVWEVPGPNRLTYRLEGSDDSAFEFRAALQSPSLLAADGRLAYQVGIRLSGGRVQPQRVTLFGTWKLNRDLSVSFEVPYAQGRMGSLRFEGSYALSSKDRIAVTLQNGQRQGLGVVVVFTRKLVPDAQVFLRLQRAAEDTSLIGGVQFRF